MSFYCPNPECGFVGTADDFEVHLAAHEALMGETSWPAIGAECMKMYLHEGRASPTFAVSLDLEASPTAKHEASPTDADSSDLGEAADSSDLGSFICQAFGDMNACSAQNCDARFEHHATHHNNDDIDMIGDNDVIVGRAVLEAELFPFTCETCGMGLDTASTYDAHEATQTHTPPPPSHLYFCDRCDASLPCHEDLDAHMKTHAHTYFCGCGASCMTKRECSLHEASHTHAAASQGAYHATRSHDPDAGARGIVH